MAIGKIYGLCMTSVWAAGINFTSDTIKCSLHTASYVPDQDTHQYFSSVTNEVSGTGYTAGGTTLTGKAVAYDAASNTLKLSCANPSWTTATLSAVRYAVFYKSTGTASSSPLICYMDFEADQSVTAANLSIVIPTTGLLTLSVA